MSGAEAIEQRDCCGSRCAALVTGEGSLGSAGEAAALACRSLLDWHRRFSRFEPDSELSLLNRDERRTVPVSPVMARLADAIRYAAAITRGLVDGTLLAQIEQAGYSGELDAGPSLAHALELAPARGPASSAPGRPWEQLTVDLDALTVTRPPGLRLDSGGLGKGVVADVLGERLAGYDGVAIDCGGDIAIGGAAAQ
ncbi:MAG: FAD:protein FMN transferase, partial [Solirubrobacteraceae bacterium]